MGRQGNDRDVRTDAAGPNAPGGFDAIQFRHLDVHQDEVDLVAMFGKLAQGEGAVVGETNRCTERFQQFAHNQLIGRHVFGNKDGGAAQRHRLHRSRPHCRTLVTALHVSEDFPDSGRGSRFFDDFIEDIERAAQIGRLRILRGHHHQVGALAQLGAQHAGQGQAVDARHVEIDHDAVKAALVCTQAGQGGAARIVGVHRAAVFLEQTGENVAGQFIVVDDQETVV